MPATNRVNPPGDYYRVLGIPEDASVHEIRRAYRRLARRHHPDLSARTDAARRFSEVSDAYQVLHDPGERAATTSTTARARTEVDHTRSITNEIP